MNKKYLFVANWKMYLSHKQECAWIQEHKAQLATHAREHTLVICPSFVSLPNAQHELAQTDAKLGAQECSPNPTGPYTGQICAQSLKECGCSFCIIGHSEQRAIDAQYDVATRAQQLLEHNIAPIICVSDLTEHFIAPIRDLCQKFPSAHIMVAYEPLAAIGTGNAASAEHVQRVLQKLAHELESAQRLSLLYGGSVDGKNSAAFKKIPELDGFLIGKASTEIDQLCAIITTS